MNRKNLKPKYVTKGKCTRKKLIVQKPITDNIFTFYYFFNNRENIVFDTAVATESK